MSDWFRTVGLSRPAPGTGRSLRWLWSSTLLVWFGVPLISVGYARGLESLTYHEFQLESIKRELRRNPDLDNPLTAANLLPNAVQRRFADGLVWIRRPVLYGRRGVTGRWAHSLGLLTFLASLLFSGACLFLASEMVDYTADCFRWRFIAEGLGMSAVLLGLAIGGVSAVVLCLPIGSGPQPRI